MKRFLRRSAIVLAPILLISLFRCAASARGWSSRIRSRRPMRIFVLGGTRFERPLEAVELYKAGWAPRIALMRQVSDYGEVHLMKRASPFRAKSTRR